MHNTAPRRLTLELLERRDVPAVYALPVGAPVMDSGIDPEGRHVLVGHEPASPDDQYPDAYHYTLNSDDTFARDRLTNHGGEVRATGVSDNGLSVVGFDAFTGFGLLWDRGNWSNPVEIPTIGYPESPAFDVSDNGIAVGDTGGWFTPYKFSVATGIEALPEQYQFAGATSVSADGSVIGGGTATGAALESWWPTVWDANGLRRLPVKYVDWDGGFVVDVSPDGHWMSGYSFTAIVWHDERPIFLRDAAGLDVVKRALRVTDSGFAVGGDRPPLGGDYGLFGSSFIWHPNWVSVGLPFNGAVTIDHFYETVTGESLPARTTVGLGLMELAGGGLAIATRAEDGNSYLIVLEDLFDVADPTQIGTPDDDNFTINVTGLDRLDVDMRQGGNDRITLTGTPAAGLRVAIRTGDGNDTIDIKTAVDVFAELGGGNDVFRAAKARDVYIDAGDGNDSLVGGSHANTLIGGAGNDTLIGGKGADILLGETGNDRLAGGAGSDTYRFGYDWGNDTLAEPAAAGTDSVEFKDATVTVGGLLKAISVDLVGGKESRLTQTSGRIEEVISSGGTSNKLQSGNGANVWQVTGNGAGTVNGFRFAGFGALIGGAGADRFAMAPGVEMFGYVDGGGGANTLDYSAHATPVTFNRTMATATGFQISYGGPRNITAVRGGSGADTLVGPAVDTVWSITANDGGRMGAVSFTGFENLTGGAGVDTFKFKPGRRITGTVDGGDGRNTLDYSAYTQGVEVNLRIGSAPAVGAIARIANAVGGAGSDVLVALATGSTLTGGAGRDLLIGGASSSLLSGGSGDDLLIGGTTSFDSDPVALRTLLAEWKRPASYAVRIDHLTGELAGGLNGSNVLNSTTVPFSQFGGDTLTGGTGLDWFVPPSTGQLNVLTEVTAGEQVGLE